MFFCYSHSFRCDSKMDCTDDSDENYCNYLIIKDNYAKQLIPKVRPHKPVEVAVGFYIPRIPKIDTYGLYYC